MPRRELAAKKQRTREISQRSANARNNALRRLRAENEERYQEIYAEEAAKLGVRPGQPGQRPKKK